MRCPRCDYSMPSGDRFCGRCGLARPTDGVPVDPLLGLTVAGRYRIDRRIGVGGMGTVYLGTHVRVGQRVAVKVLHERYAGDRALTQRFENEALTYARVSHPNLVALHDFGRTPDGCYFMVLEYCPGTALARLVRRHERLDPTLVVEVIIQVAQGLGAAHAAGIVHRDLKPENVMMVEAGPGRYHVKLLDFGIAKRLDDDGPRLTQAGMVFGTPEYMAPEQARGERVDGRSDIYALGCLLYELLTGDPPFVGSNKLQVMHRQASEKPRPPSESVPGIPPALEAITLRCLEKRPADRFSSTDEFIAALEKAFGTERPTPVPPPVRLRETRVPERARGVEADTAL
ncbi:MAG: serine/threonine-protein kinase, partial [bacterium]